MFYIKLAKNTKYYNGYLWKLYFLSLIVHCIFTMHIFISFHFLDVTQMQHDWNCVG